MLTSVSRRTEAVREMQAYAVLVTSDRNSCNDDVMQLRTHRVTKTKR